MLYSVALPIPATIRINQQRFMYLWVHYYNVINFCYFTVASMKYKLSIKVLPI